MSYPKMSLTSAVLCLLGAFAFAHAATPKVSCAYQLGDSKIAIAASIDPLRTVGLSDGVITAEQMCLEDRVQQQVAEAPASIVCATDGTLRHVPVGMDRIANSLCPAIDECENTENPGCGRGDGYTSADTTTPYILSPRRKILSTQPTIRWSAIPGVSQYTVSLKRGSQDIWEPIKVEGTEIDYPGEIPLEAGASYTLTVTAENGVTATGEFRLVNAADRVQILSLLAMQPTETTDVIPPQVYIYTQYRLFSEAIETLETAISHGNRDAAIFLRLGEIYKDIELPLQAEQAYLEASQLAKTEGNLRGQALAHTRLGQLYRDTSTGSFDAASHQFSLAKTLYEQADAADLAAKVEILLQELPAQSSTN